MPTGRTWTRGCATSKAVSTGAPTGHSLRYVPTSRNRTGGNARSASPRWRIRLVLGLDPRIVQRAVVEVLNAIYETDFLGFSYGFRPPAFAGAGSRGQHDALDALAAGIESQAVNWILDADI